MPSDVPCDEDYLSYLVCSVGVRGGFQGGFGHLVPATWAARAQLWSWDWLASAKPVKVPV